MPTWEPAQYVDETKFEGQRIQFPRPPDKAWLQASSASPETSKQKIVLVKE